MKGPDLLFEIGQLYCQRGDFSMAVSKLQAASDCFEKIKENCKYLECQTLLLRIYAEMDDQSNIQLVKEKLQSQILKNEIQLTAKVYYLLALCTLYKGQQKIALEYFAKALSTALAADDKQDVCYAIYGLATVYFQIGRYAEALREIQNLQVFFQVLDLPELKLTSQILNGHIFRAMGQADRALHLYWQSYENLKDQKHLYRYVDLLYAMGLTYKDLNNMPQARIYLELAKRSADPKNLRMISRAIDHEFKTKDLRDDPEYDLLFDSSSNSVTERKRGRIDFKNQFILMDLLQLFVKSPGQVHSKEHLVKRIWKQDYDPAVHDNKIYVTIKRLRKMIEPDFEKPRYIFRAKNGYYLSRNTRVAVNGSNGFAS